MTEAKAAAGGTFGAAGGELKIKSEGPHKADGLTAGNTQVIRDEVDVLIKRNSAMVKVYFVYSTVSS